MQLMRRQPWCKPIKTTNKTKSVESCFSYICMFEDTYHQCKFKIKNFLFSERVLGVTCLIGHEFLKPVTLICAKTTQSSFKR